MGVLIGYMANRTDCLLDALKRERTAITPEPSDDPTGWGVGFYQGGEVLHKKRRRLSAAHVDFAEIVDGVVTDCAIIHLRQATVGDFRTENTHPFRMRSWLFAHSGTIHRFSALKERLVEAMPDFIRRCIRGETDSEHFFHLIASFLHDGGQLERGGDDPEPVLHALRSSIRLVDRLANEVGADAPTLNCMLTDGQSLFALCRGGPMHVIDRTLHSSPPESTPRRASRLPGPRYVLIEGARQQHGADRTPVEQGHVCVVGRDLSVQVHPV